MPTSTPQSSLRKPAASSGRVALASQFAVLLIVTVLFTAFDLDRRVAELFYRQQEGWYLGKQPLWVWLHAYGTIPGIVLTLAALGTWLAGFYVRRLFVWRRPCLIVVLTTMLAAGLLVNAVLKQYWGRPRPGQTVEFGGKWNYRHIFPPGTPGKGASFPCGHCTMGFVFLSMAGFRHRSRALAYGGVATGVVLGGLLSAGRVVQGAHFVSDTVWSLGIITMVATALALYLPHPRPESESQQAEPLPRRRRIGITFAVLVAVVVISIGFLTRRPYYNTMVYPLDLPSPIDTIHIRINGDPEIFNIRYADGQRARLEVDAHGFGWVEFDYRMGYGCKVQGKNLNITLHIEARSYFAELDHALTLTLPKRIKGQVDVRVNNQPISAGPSGNALSDRPSFNIQTIRG